MLTDSTFIYGPTRDGHRARALLHAGERRALPRGGVGAGHRGAGRRRARPSLQARARRLAAPVLEALGRRRSGRVLEFVRGSGLRLGIEADYVPGREDRMATLLDEHEWDYVVGSVHFIRDDAVDMRGEWDVWRTTGDPEKVWAAYFDDPRRGGPDRDVRRARPSGPREGVGRARARRRPAPLLRSRDGRDRGVGRGHRGFHRRAAQAGRRALSGAPVSRDVPRGGQAGRAVVRRPPARAGRPSSTTLRSSCSTAWASGSSPCSTAATAGSRRSDERPGRGSASTRTGSRPAARWCLAAW